MRAWLNLRHSVHERREAFIRGLKRHDYTVIEEISSRPRDGDIMVTWNRIGAAHHAACAFESRGLQVLVTENASWGNRFAGERWYTMARNYHNSAGCFSVDGDERWDELREPLKDWRDGGERVVLPQRGIGPPAVAMPEGWTQKQIGRVRMHPGTKPCTPLDEDLAQAGSVVTWGSGAAIRALQLGIRVESHMPGWIGEQDNTTHGRLAMFRRLAWAQWRLSEIEDGTAFARLLA